MRFDGFAIGLKRLRVLCAALALSAASGSAALAAGQPYKIYSLAPPGSLVTVDPARYFLHGTNPRFTEATFSTTEYYSSHEISDGQLLVQVKTDAELNALSPPPPARFTVTATVTMTNDEGLTASSMIEFQTEYRRNAPTLPQPGGPPAPTFIQQSGAAIAPPGHLMSTQAHQWFDNAGTNPRITDAVFSTTEYYKEHSISRGFLWFEVKSTAELNALPSPPPSPFRVDVTVTMTNDEGRTASGTITFETEYVRAAAAEPSQPTPEAAGPVLSLTRIVDVDTNGVSMRVDPTFANAGRNPRFTGADFSTREYYNITLDAGWLRVRAKTAAELNALTWPPPSTFTVTATVTMENDEGQTASGTITFRTTYDRTSSRPSAPVPPTFSQTENYTLAPWGGEEISAGELFDNTGTNPRITEAVFSTRKYFQDGPSNVPRVAHGKLSFTLKTAAMLNAMTPPPPSPFTFTADVTMENDEDFTASGQVTFQVTYKRDASADPVPLPTDTVARELRPGGGWAIKVLDLFPIGGTNPILRSAVFSATEYYSTHEFSSGRHHSQVPTLYVNAKTAAQLNALALPPPSPFTVTVVLTLTNDEGETVTGNIAFTTTYDRPAPEPAPDGPTPSTMEARWAAPPGVLTNATAARSFDNPGTNPRIIKAVLSTTEYYRRHYVSDGLLWVQPKTAAELSAMAPPPPSPFTVTGTITMINDEGRTAEGAIAFRTTYDRAPTTEFRPPVSHPPTQEGQEAPSR